MSEQPTSDIGLPPGWSDYIPLVTALVRQLLATAGAAGFTWALTVNASQIQMAVSAAAMAASAIWSFYQKVQAKRALRVAAVQPSGMEPPKLPA